MFFILEQYFENDKSIEDSTFKDINIKNYQIIKDELQCLSKDEINFLRKHYDKKIQKKELMQIYNLNENKYYSKIRSIIRKVYNNMNEFSKI